MKSVSKLLVVATLALISAVTTARAEDQSPAFPVQKMIEARTVKSSHVLNRPALLMAQLDVVIQFSSGSSKVPAAEVKKLKGVAAAIKSKKGGHVAVQGYTDNKGSDALNQRLSYHRAVAVMNILVKKYGVPASMLSAQGFGKENPVADNSTAEGRAMNRRVTFACTKSGR
ncbi:MAG: OmpA family protein [Alphaproteobacteria bacterium]